ncbi:MAG: SIR2 family protein [Lewinellaceae bacterium]|nr:SIR2 family protein [Lewinellaceae bacterium]
MLEKKAVPLKGKNNAGETVEEFEIPNYEFIVQTIQTGKCVLLLGPDACLATDKIGRTTTFTRLTAAALLRSRRVRQYYKEEDLFQFRSETEENEARYDLKKVFLRPYPTAYYEEIAQIPFHLVIYSSPAPCLRKTFEQHRLPHTHDYFNRFGTPPVMSAPSAECPLLYQITGSMQDPDSLILTYDDMFEYVAAILGQQKLPNSVKTALLDDNVKHLILLGFRLDRWYVHLLLQLLQYKKVKSRLRTYAYSQSLPPHIRVFCREQFNVSFVSTPPEEFIHRLFLHAQAYAQTPRSIGGRICTSAVIGSTSNRQTGNIYLLCLGKGIGHNSG